MHSRLSSLLLIGLLFSSFILFSPVVHSVTVEEVYTNAFSATAVAWVEVGATPYLNDSNANYIYVTTNAKLESYWTFANSSGSGTINSVKLLFESRQTYDAEYGPGSFKVEVWNGSAWNNLGNITPTDAYSWQEVDASTVLDSWDEINVCRMRVTSIKGTLQTVTMYVRRLTRKVDYTTAPVGEWHDVSTWTFQLPTRQWNIVGTWTYQILTRQWNTIGAWTIQLIARGSEHTTEFEGLYTDGELKKVDPYTTPFIDCWNASSADYNYNETLLAEIGMRYTGIGYPTLSWVIERAFVFFDTSIINGRILEANLTLYCNLKPTPIVDFNVTIQNGQPAYPSDPLTLSNFWQGYYSGNGGAINTTEISGNDFFTVQLNEDGKSWINMDGATKLCLRSNKDIDGQQPIGYEDIMIRTREGDDYFPSNESKAPKLTVKWVGMDWVPVGQWVFQLSIIGWFTVATWIFLLESSPEIGIIPILLLFVVIGALIVLTKKRVRNYG